MWWGGTHHHGKLVKVRGQPEGVGSRLPSGPLPAEPSLCPSVLLALTESHLCISSWLVSASRMLGSKVCITRGLYLRKKILIVLPARMSVHLRLVSKEIRREGIGSPGTRVRYGYESPCACWELNLGPLLLTIEYLSRPHSALFPYCA